MGSIQYSFLKSFVLEIVHLTAGGPVYSLPSSLAHRSYLCILKMNTAAVIGMFHIELLYLYFQGQNDAAEIRTGNFRFHW